MHDTTAATKRWILPVIVLAQFGCTAVWFAGNAVMKELMLNFSLPASALGYLTSAVQFGFITGTLSYTLLMIADRFPPSRVFCISALAAAAINLATILPGQSLISLVALRFLTGFFLAGIYPVGMKIASDHYRALGPALGFLVGALVIGTAFPHVLKSAGLVLPWKTVMRFTSTLCLAGGLALWLTVPNGPYRKTSQRPEFTMLSKVFRDKKFLSASLGYFGHMWELYAFWAFVPVILAAINSANTPSPLNVPLLSFFIIGLGGPACMLSGWLSQRWGPARLAAIALCISGGCCLLSPLLFILPVPLAITFLMIWGMAVVADSPLFTSMVAGYAPAEARGTALTAVTCTGFFITIISIQLLTSLFGRMDTQWIFLVLAPGPALGLAAFSRGMQEGG